MFCFLIFLIGLLAALPAVATDTANPALPPDLAFNLESYKVREPAIKIWKDGAVLAGAVDLEGTSAGAPFKQRMRFADVWRKSGGKWQVVFAQVTRVSGK